MRQEINWSQWILEKNQAAEGESLKKSDEVALTKAYVSAPHVPKGSCDCGAHSVGSHMHSDWCGGLQPSNSTSPDWWKYRVNPTGEGDANSTEYEVHLGDKHIGYANVDHDTWDVHGGIDWDAHPGAVEAVHEKPSYLPGDRPP